MNWKRRSAALATLLLVQSGTDAFAAPPPLDLARIAGTPAPMRGRLYADCLAEAAAAGAYDRTADKNTHLLRFHCTAAPAKALYDELGAWSASRYSEWSAAGRTWRSTAKIVRNLFGTDYCSTDGAADFACDLTMNVGEFLDGDDGKSH